MDFNKYRQTAQEIENDFIENGRSYEDALNKIVIDVFDEMEEDYKQEKSKQLIITDVVGRSEQFSFADMKAAFDYGSNSGGRHDAMTFTEWISKR